MSYQRVIVAVDVVAETAATVIERTREICDDSTSVTALHVVDESYLYLGDDMVIPGVAELHGKVMQEAERRLAALCEPAGIEDRAVAEGHPSTEVHRFAQGERADLVVIGAHGRHGWRLLLGSTANAVIHGTRCDVLCVHVPEAVRPFQRVLVAVDSTDEAGEVAQSAVDMAAKSGAMVSLMSVIRPLNQAYAGIDVAVVSDTAVKFAAEAEGQVRKRLDGLAEAAGIGGERLVRHGHPAEQIHEVAKELGADLVVIGTHGRHGFALLLGSTANAVLHGAQCDILAVRIGD